MPTVLMNKQSSKKGAQGTSLKEKESQLLIGYHKYLWNKNKFVQAWTEGLRTVKYGYSKGIQVTYKADHVSLEQNGIYNTMC